MSIHLPGGNDVWTLEENRFLSVIGNCNQLFENHRILVQSFYWIGNQGDFSSRLGNSLPINFLVKALRAFDSYLRKSLKKGLCSLCCSLQTMPGDRAPSFFGVLMIPQRREVSVEVI